MANASQHALIGGLSGAVTYLAMSKYYDRKPEFGEFVLCAGIGLLAGSVPDLLEPALDPNHRKLAHSIATGGFLAKFAADKCAVDCEWEQFQKIALASAIAGYLSHLVADGCTPRGLPLF